MKIDITQRESDALRYSIEHLTNSANGMSIPKFRNTIIRERNQLIKIYKKTTKSK